LYVWNHREFVEALKFSFYQNLRGIVWLW